MYGIGAYFALRNAIKAFNPKAGIKFDAPMTPEKVLMNLYVPQTPKGAYEDSNNAKATTSLETLK